MKLTISQQSFSKVLNSSGRIATGKAGLPVLNNVLLRTSGNRLTVAATNLEIAVTTSISAKVAEGGEITIPAKLLSEFVSNLPKEDVQLESNGTSVVVSCGGYTSTINGIVAEEFPELPVINEDTSIHYSIQTSDFKESSNQTLFAASNDPTRPVLTGVYWHSHDGSLYLVSTDGYRLAERKLIETKSELAAIIPTSTIQEVLRIMSEDTGAVDILFDETQVRFRLGDSEVTSRLIDGKYPDYRKLIPSEFETTATVQYDDIVRTSKIASLFARQVGGSITMDVSNDDNTISISSIASEVGENKSTIDATIYGGGMVSLNSRYLTEVLNVISSKTTTFSFNGKLSPILITADEMSHYKHVIMPLKS